ncbi:anti-sigma factor [Candidatus Woesearchaeota archaeon]|nr:MAG: anti-sigma factor [Candidatus Woesearchaeota archaeon]
MKRIVSIVLLIALLSVSAIAAIMDSYVSPLEFPRRYGVERVTHYDPRVGISKINTLVYLEPTFVQQSIGAGRGGYEPIFPRGTARVESSAWDGYPRGAVRVTTKDLPPSDRIGMQFEAWLVDDDTGYRLSLGQFYTLFGGVGELRYDGSLYFDAYDRVEITVEPFEDLDVLPGQVVLEGPIQKDYSGYRPPARQGRMVTESFQFI